MGWRGRLPARETKTDPAVAINVGADQGCRPVYGRFLHSMCDPHIRWVRKCPPRTWAGNFSTPTLAAMCGIVGIYSKSDSFSEELGRHLSAMLVEMAQRGPDSAGVAVYRDPVPPGRAKVSLRAEGGLDREALAAALATGLGLEEIVVHGDSLAMATVEAEPAAAEAWIGAELPELQILGAGREIEIYKDAVAPAEFVGRYGIDSVAGSHAPRPYPDGDREPRHAAGSHPFSTGRDLCLVHNGSLSNHNRLRERAAPRGHRLPDRERLRGRRRLPDLADRERRDAEGGAGELPRGPRRLLHLRRRHRRRLRRAARPDRLQAGGDGRDRRVGGDGLRVPGAGDPARRRATPRSGSPSPASSTAGGGESA